MPRWARGSLIALAVLALLIGGAWFALRQAFPPQRLAALLSQQVSDATGRSVQIGGPLSIQLLPRIAVVAKTLSVANAPWGSRPQMLKVDRAALDLQLWPLLGGDVRIDRVSLEGVDLLLEVGPGGSGNWVVEKKTAAAGETPAGSPPVRSIDLQRLHLADVQLTYKGGGGAAAQTLTLRSLDLNRAGDGTDLAAKADFAGRPWQLKGRLGSLPALLSGAPGGWPFDLRISGDGAHVAAKGSVALGKQPLSAKLDLQAALDKPAALAPWVDASTPLPLPIELKTALDWHGDTLSARDLRLSMAGQSVDGSANIEAGKPLRIDAQLHSASIDVERWLPKRGGGAATGPASGGRLFGSGALPLTRLPDANATVALHIEKLTLPGAPPLAELKTTLKTRAGAAEADPLAFAVAGGRVNGSVVVKADGASPPRIALQLDGDDLSVPALARAAGAGGSVANGSAKLRTRLNLAGATPHALAGSASGSVLLQAGGFTLLDDPDAPLAPRLLQQVLKALRPGRGPSRATFECAVARLPLNNGVATIDRSIAFETDELAVSASGRIDLRDETIELAFDPLVKAAGGIDASRLASLVALKGPLRDPKLAIDAKGIADIALSRGGAAGGLSGLAKELLGPKSGGDRHPCRTAMTGEAPPQPAAPTPRALPKKEEAIPQLLQRLFRK